jgi:hypothetical protein
LQGTIARCLPLLGWGIGGLGSSIVISSFLYPHSWMFNPELIIGSESQILDRQLHFVGIFFDHDAPEAHSCPLSYLITRKRFSHLELIMTTTPDEPRRKLKVMVITMGGPRQEMIEDLFRQPLMAQHFEAPVFSPGVSSRALRCRAEFLRIANDVGLIPPEEWTAMENAKGQERYEKNRGLFFFDCLDQVPILAQGRRGNDADLKLHYSVELWQKAKSLNRGRAVLACAFAHLMALKRFTSEGFDVLMEDNVRASPASCAERIWQAHQASLEWERQEEKTCHFRFVGWLGSTVNLEWILETHSKKRRYQRQASSSDDQQPSAMSVFPFPTHEHLEEDLKEMEETKEGQYDSSPEKRRETEEEELADGETSKASHQTPGGTAIWGAYAYWMSKEAYESMLHTLQLDVGAMLWKGKRMRVYAVKPVDKILPRITQEHFGPPSVHIATHPAFFRAPMLTSKIHTRWDPDFCRSTEFQLGHTDLDWSKLWLVETEREIVNHHQSTGNWLTPAEWNEFKSASS